MTIHKVVLFSERRKLFLRVVWTRGKREASTQWCEGVKEFKLEQKLVQQATMFIDESNKKHGPKITSKDSKLCLELRDRLDGKITKYAKLNIDLSKYINLEKPDQLLNKKIIFEKQKNNKQTYISITVKATEKSMKKGSKKVGSSGDGTISNSVNEENEYSITMTEDQEPPSQSRASSSIPPAPPITSWGLENTLNDSNRDSLSMRKDNENEHSKPPSASSASSSGSSKLRKAASSRNFESDLSNKHRNRGSSQGSKDDMHNKNKNDDNNVNSGGRRKSGSKKSKSSIDSGGSSGSGKKSNKNSRRRRGGIGITEGEGASSPDMKNVKHSKKSSKIDAMNGKKKHEKSVNRKNKTSTDSPALYSYDMQQMELSALNEMKGMNGHYRQGSSDIASLDFSNGRIGLNFLDDGNGLSKNVVDSHFHTRKRSNSATLTEEMLKQLNKERKKQKDEKKRRNSIDSVTSTNSPPPNSRSSPLHSLKQQQQQQQSYHGMNMNMNMNMNLNSMSSIGRDYNERNDRRRRVSNLSNLSDFSNVGTLPRLQSGKRTYGHYLMADRHRYNNRHQYSGTGAESVMSDASAMSDKRHMMDGMSVTSTQDSEMRNDEIFDQMYDIEKLAEKEKKDENVLKEEKQQEMAKEKEKGIKKGKNDKSEKGSDIEIETSDKEEDDTENKNEKKDEEDSKTSNKHENNINNINNVNKIETNLNEKKEAKEEKNDETEQAPTRKDSNGSGMTGKHVRNGDNNNNNNSASVESMAMFAQQLTELEELRVKVKEYELKEKEWKKKESKYEKDISQISNLKSEIEGYRTTQSYMCDNLDKMTIREEELRDQISNHEQIEVGFKQTIRELMNENDQLKIDLSKKNEFIVELNESKESMMKKLNSFEEMNNKYNDLLNDQMQWQAQRKNLKQETIQLELDLEMAKEEQMKIECDLKMEIDKQKESILKLEKEIAQIENDLKQEKIENEKMKNKCKDGDNDRAAIIDNIRVNKKKENVKSHLRTTSDPRSHMNENNSKNAIATSFDDSNVKLNGNKNENKNDNNSEKEDSSIFNKEKEEHLIGNNARTSQEISFTVEEMQIENEINEINKNGHGNTASIRRDSGSNLSVNTPSLGSISDSEPSETQMTQRYEMSFDDRPHGLGISNLAQANNSSSQLSPVTPVKDGAVDTLPDLPQSSNKMKRSSVVLSKNGKNGTNNGKYNGMKIGPLSRIPSHKETTDTNSDGMSDDDELNELQTELNKTRKNSVVWDQRVEALHSSLFKQASDNNENVSDEKSTNIPLTFKNLADHNNHTIENNDIGNTNKGNENNDNNNNNNNNNNNEFDIISEKSKPSVMSSNMQNEMNGIAMKVGLNSQQIAAMVKQMNEKKQSSNDSNNSNNTMLSQLFFQTQKGQLQEKDMSLQRMQSEWLKAEAERMKLQRSLDVEKHKYNGAKIKLEKCKNKLDKTEMELARLKETTNQLKKQNEDLEDTYVKLKFDFTNLMDKANNLDYHNTQLQTQLDNALQANKQTSIKEKGSKLLKKTSKFLPSK